MLGGHRVLCRCACTHRVWVGTASCARPGSLCVTHLLSLQVPEACLGRSACPAAVTRTARPCLVTPCTADPNLSGVCHSEVCLATLERGNLLGPRAPPRPHPHGHSGRGGFFPRKCCPHPPAPPTACPRRNPSGRPRGQGTDCPPLSPTPPAAACGACRGRGFPGRAAGRAVRGAASLSPPGSRFCLGCRPDLSPQHSQPRPSSAC